MEQHLKGRACVTIDRALPSAEELRTRKHMLALEWRIPDAGGDPVWKETTDLRAALDRLLDTPEKRAIASRLVLAWEALHVPGQLAADLESLHDLDRSLDQMRAVEMDPSGSVAAPCEFDASGQRSRCSGLEALWTGAI